MAVVKPGDQVHVHKVDRLGRNTVDIIQTAQMFLNRDVSLHVLGCGGHAVNLEGAMGFMMLAFPAVFAEAEGKRISERTKENLNWGRDRGMPVNKYSPYGMKRKARKENGKHKPYDEWDAQECQDIREIYHRLEVDGEYLYQMAIEFAMEYRKTANGKPWAKPPKRAGKKWRDDRVRKVKNWYHCLREMGMDVESTPVYIAALFSSAWQAAGQPRNLASWRIRRREGLEEFMELAWQSMP